MTWRRCYGIRLETDHLFYSSFFDWGALRSCLDAGLRALGREFFDDRVHQRFEQIAHLPQRLENTAVQKLTKH